ncbi:MAG: DUF177 domain-containing protein [Ruminococcaceae bacterium]|nr:DUF177 domain-containing protein [Oscillospiraceae bacterium]
MILDLKRIFATDNSVLEIDHTLDMSEVDFFGNYPLKTPVIIKGSVSNRASVVSLNLNIEYTFAAPCDRCGVFAQHNHTVIVDKLLATAIERQESDTIITVPDMKLDVDEFVYSEVILDLPSKHLCNDDCKGICFKCGKNLNEGECGCSTKEVDPRLAKLMELLDN